MPLIKIATISPYAWDSYTLLESFVFVDSSTINNIHPETFVKEDGEAIHTISFTSDRLSFNTPWKLNIFLSAIGASYSTTYFDNEASRA